MPDEILDVTADPSTANPTDANADPSTAAPVETTTQKVEPVTPEIRFAETEGANKRIRDLIEEQKFLRDQLAAANSRQIVSSAPAPVEADPYAGMDAETKAFMQRVEQVAESKAKKVVAAEKEPLLRELNETRQILATVAYERFQSKHPDIIADSSEETTIAKLYSRGYTLDDAYKVAMFDKIRDGKAQQAQVTKVNAVKQRVAANLETSSIPANSGLPQIVKKSVRERISDIYEAAQKGG